MATPSLPDIKKAASMFTSMLRREVKLTALKPVPDKDYVSVGHYVNRDKKLVGAVFADKAMTLYAGAALSLVPADAAKDALKEPELDEIMRENFAEVLNVCSRMIEMSDEGRVMLSATEFPSMPRSAVTTGALAKPLKRVDFDVEIQGYGKGRFGMALIAA